MSTTPQVSAAHGVRPRQPAPELTVPLLRGGNYRLEEQTPDLFTMIVFFRGLHCPVCRAQLSELDRRLDELNSRGIDVIAVSGETLERTTNSRVNGSSSACRSPMASPKTRCAPGACSSPAGTARTNRRCSTSLACS